MSRIPPRAQSEAAAPGGWLSGPRRISRFRIGIASMSAKTACGSGGSAQRDFSVPSLPMRMATFADSPIPWRLRTDSSARTITRSRSRHPAADLAQRRSNDSRFVQSLNDTISTRSSCAANAVRLATKKRRRNGITGGYERRSRVNSYKLGFSTLAAATCPFHPATLITLRPGSSHAKAA